MYEALERVSLEGERWTRRLLAQTRPLDGGGLR